MATYSIQFTNNSTNGWNACVFQQDQNISIPGVMSLAWFEKNATRVQSATFRGTLNTASYGLKPESLYLV